MKTNLFSSNRHTLNLKNFLPKEAIDYLCSDCERFRIFDPATTLFYFLFQVLDGCSVKSCLIFLSLHRKKLGLKQISMNSAALVKAKKRLCETKLKNLVRFTGLRLESCSALWKFKNRDVYLGDGTIINLEDTKKIQKEYPLTFSNGRAQGQPKMRLFGIFCASSAGFIDGELGAYCGKGQGETSLFKNMIQRLKKGSIVVLDRFFTGYQLQALMRDENIDYVIRARDRMARKALGKKVDVVIKVKNIKRSDKRLFIYEKAPDYMEIRYIKSSIKRAGFRVAHLYILTNLFIEDGFTKKDIEKLYLKRWNVEVNIRHLKTTLEGSMLRSKSAELARKELWVHLLAYNLIRGLNNLCANKFKHASPDKQSFKLAMKAYLYSLVSFNVEDDILLTLKNEIQKSKYRREPRALKKRFGRYPLLTTSRKLAKKENWGYCRRRGQLGLNSSEET